MNDDNITVDEPLISTDVDSLIRTIAERKKVQLNDLRRECRIDKKTMDKWIAVLEDEGYIDIEYGIRGTNIIWRSASDSVRSSIEVPESRPISAMRPSKVVPEEHVQETPDGESEEEEDPGPNPEFTAETPLEEEAPEAEPEELLSQYLAKKRGGSEDIDSLKSSILTSMDEKDSEKTVVLEAGPDEEEPEEEESSEAEEREEEAVKKEPFPTIRPTRARPPSADVRELMATYMDEINKEKATIEKLKKDKEELYRDKVAAMEKRMQADVVVLTEKIVEAQTRLADLKEHVLELPDKVDELDKLQRQMETLKAEGRQALERTRENTDEYLSHLADSKSEVEEKLSQAEVGLDTHSGKVEELEKLASSLDARAGKLRSALDAARTQADELNSAIETLTADVETVERSKAEVEQTVDSIKSSVADRGSELESLQQELEGIERMEHWMQEYVRDYEHKIEEIENYVSKSDDEMAELKEAAEALYLKKYLSELESMTEAYQGELEDAVSQEASIEQRISESRDRITHLVKESQEMIKKVREDAPDASEKDFGILVAKAKAKTAVTKRLVEEKQKERESLAEESEETSKSAKSRPSKKPSKKPKKKKKKLKKKKK